MEMEGEGRLGWEAMESPWVPLRLRPQLGFPVSVATGLGLSKGLSRLGCKWQCLCRRAASEWKTH